jgi:Uma2 family endonuclease
MPIHLLPGPFTVDTYHRLAELGILGEDDRVELLDGQIVAMTPIGSRHAAAVGRLTRVLGERAGTWSIVWVQNPIVVSQTWEPQPDVCLLRPRDDFYAAAHPRADDALLVIEVADTSLERDRDVKIPRYAAAGIPEAWLVDLAGDAVTVYVAPGPDGYGETVTVSRGETLRPVRLPGLAVAVDDVLG